MHVQAMISSHPQLRGEVNRTLVAAIEAAYVCAQTCTACADACLAEEDVTNLSRCIRLDLDCADICSATGSVASRRTGSNEAVMRHMLEACAEICRLCAEECGRHAHHHDHCRVCAEACRDCDEACRAAIETLAPMQ
ncbi:four-helix bundle copper-binding protein [Methyloraptor flagellatus]|jgi:hypothetical protein|uniref:Four-helix bundle copper-binding protein n=1 Tax=Methyloraptor flagellatus TaxID=3162530 RepID=A0AAU7XA18_9HYPH